MAETVRDLLAAACRRCRRRSWHPSGRRSPSAPCASLPTRPWRSSTRSGIGRGDRVAIVLPNGPEMATAFVTVACGATTAPLNPAYRAEEFDFYLTDLRAKALIVADGDEGPAVEVARRHGPEILRLATAPDRPAGWFELRPRAAAAAAVDDRGRRRTTTRRWCCTPRAPPRGPRSCRCSSATSRPRRATSAPRWR